MLRFGVREVAGWLFAALGLFVFYLCWQMLMAHLIFEAGPLVVIGIVLFRGGIHLIKVAVAAQVCLEARRQMGEIARESAGSPARTIGRRPAARGAVTGALQTRA